MANYPDLTQVTSDMKAVRKALLAATVPGKLIDAIKTKATLTGRKTTGEWATNRESRWKIDPLHPQYGAELDCKIIFVKLCAQIFCFDNAPPLSDPLKSHLEQNYLGYEIKPNSYRDTLLLERFDFDELVQEGLKPVHGHSGFHIGHEDPTIKPKHQPGNIAWRTYRSNLIQGNMTLREARIYFVKLIGRYFELGEINIA